MTSLAALALSAWCAMSCGARTAAVGAAPLATGDAAPSDAPDAHAPAPDVGGCGSDRDCASGERCLGPPGCGAPWACTPVLGCLRDLTLYCGCDGRTGAGSSDCPGRPYAQRGPCNPGLCASPDARAEGDCARPLGYVWDGFNDCLLLSGCRCVGAACGRVTRTEAECAATHASCRWE